MTTQIKSEKGQDIAEAYDLTLLQSADYSDDGQMMVKLEFAVGNVYDPEAGIHGGAVSPWFELATDAYTWCADNEAFLDGMFGDPEPVRQAKCYLCKKMRPAVDGLAYSGKRGEGEYDIIDCGCRGWD